LIDFSARRKFQIFFESGCHRKRKKRKKENEKEMKKRKRKKENGNICFR